LKNLRSVLPLTWDTFQTHTKQQVKLYICTCILIMIFSCSATRQEDKLLWQWPFARLKTDVYQVVRAGGMNFVAQLIEYGLKQPA
jgi:hypothetical protein